MALSGWSTTAASNASVGSIDFSENQAPNKVNDSARALMADVRTFYENIEWRDWGHTITRSDDDTFTVSSSSDLSSVYVAGRRFKYVGASTVYGVIASTSYAGTTQTVNVTVDGAAALPLTPTSVSLGINPTSNPYLAPGTTGQILQSAGSSSIPAFADRLNAATVGSVSGTTIDITDIPSWAKRVTVILSGISTTGASGYKMLLGDSGGFETSGYTSRHGFFNTASQSVAASTDGFRGYHSASAADTSIQRWVFENVGGNAWVATMVGSDSDISMCYTAGYKALSDTLTQIRLTTVSGDTFDSGSVYAFYE